MKSITSKKKLWIIITVAVLVVGFVFFAIFGLNKSVDFKDSYEVSISVDDYNIDNATKTQETVEKYFLDNGYKFVKDAEQLFDSSLGYKLVYKFANDIEIDTFELKQIVSGLYDASYNMTVSVEYRDVVVSNQTYFGWALLALGLALVASFIYVLIFEKGIGALTMALVSLVGSFLYFALVAITRIPTNNYFAFMLSSALVLGAVLSSGMVNRFREEIRLNDSVSNGSEKLSNPQIADKAALSSLLRFVFVFGALLIVSLVMIAFGAVTVKIIGLNLLVVAISSVFASFVGTPLIWSALKDCKK